MQEEIGLGVVGAGGHAMNGHVVPGIPLGFRVVAVVDPSADNIRKLGETVGYKPVVCTFKKLLTSKDVHAVLITSPDVFHPIQLLRVVLAGKAVLCDKPLAVNWWGMLLVRLAFMIAVHRDIAVMSCHPRREDADLPYGWVKAELSAMERRYGKLSHVALDFSYHKPVAAWKAHRSLLLDHFTHEVDFLMWILGARRFWARRLVDGPYKYAVAGEMAGGITFSFLGTRMLDGSTFPETIFLRFERGDCLVNTKTGAVVRRDHETEAVEEFSISAIDYDRRSERIMGEFARAIRLGVDERLLDELLINNRSAVALAGKGHFTHK